MGIRFVSSLEPGQLTRALTVLVHSQVRSFRIFDKDLTGYVKVSDLEQVQAWFACARACVCSRMCLFYGAGMGGLLLITAHTHTRCTLHTHTRCTLHTARTHTLHTHTHTLHTAHSTQHTHTHTHTMHTHAHARIYTRRVLIQILTQRGEKLPKKSVKGMLALCDVTVDGYINYEALVRTVQSKSGSVNLMDLVKAAK